MWKKFFSVLLLLFMFNITLPVMARMQDSTTYNISSHLSSVLNVNKSSKGQIVQFISDENINLTNGSVIPGGTIFNGKISSIKKSRFAFRRAKAAIIIDEMILPDGRKFSISGNTHRHVYKGSVIGNIAKGIVGFPSSIVAGAVGVVFMVVETCTIIGIVLVPATAAITGGTIGKLTNGVNCVKEPGSTIKLNVVIPNGIILENLEQSK